MNYYYLYLNLAGIRIVVLDIFENMKSGIICHLTDLHVEKEYSFLIMLHHKNFQQFFSKLKIFVTEN